MLQKRGIFLLFYIIKDERVLPWLVLEETPIKHMVNHIMQSSHYRFFLKALSPQQYIPLRKEVLSRAVLIHIQFSRK